MMTSSRSRHRFRTRPLALFLAALASLLVPARLRGEVAELTADAIVDNMLAANLRRAQALRAYTGSRTYTLDYRGFPGGRHAEMRVQATYTSPASKEFTIVSQTGSGMLQKRVLERLLDSEREALQASNRRRNELTPENYRFELAGAETTPAGDCYVLNVTPRKKSKFLCRGKVWIDAAEFAVARIEAEPAANPSFWISRTRIRHDYVKIGEFWLPAHNQSVTNVRLGGKATLTIDYSDYTINPETMAAGAK